jgi:hypothetical protein
VKIRNKYCLLSELAQVQIDKLVGLVPCADYFDFRKSEVLIGFSPNGNAGTWSRGLTDEIITYKEMLSLLGEKEEEVLFINKCFTDAVYADNIDFNEKLKEST